MTRVIFVRHCQSAPSPGVPEEDWPLTEKGLRQAEALIPILQELGVEAVASSPFARAIQTLQPFADAAGLVIHIDEDLRERRLTDAWLPDEAAVHTLVRRMFAEPEFAGEGGESATACLARFEAAIGRTIALQPGKTIAIASHGGVLGHLLAPHHGEPPFEFWRRIRNPHLFLFDYGDSARWVGEQTLEGEPGVTVSGRKP